MSIKSFVDDFLKTCIFRSEPEKKYFYATEMHVNFVGKSGSIMFLPRDIPADVMKRAVLCQEDDKILKFFL